ncbi:hypothetical protein PYK79_54290 [Streptomyces sp. ID05-04B]|uniref:hypothetical protein n=1 Tax=Streptomyces sp. ID05-04B TaxID=3028661 RepID=UPI0029C3B688|nr:hypothetical protein [Streptomyces sp. ID05-04B]MDX5570469.1 hypothetical protein [Streptomyces sp. ID05-04B]
MPNPTPEPQQRPHDPRSGWAATPPLPQPSLGIPSRRRQRIKFGATAAVALFVGVGIGAAGGGPASGGTVDAKAVPGPTVTVTETARGEAGPAPTVTETVSETVTAQPKKAEAAGAATTFSGEGEYLVGEDVKPRTYKSAGPEGEFGCYWERAKDAGGEFGSIIADNSLEGPGRVTLHKGEYFKTNRCEEWKKVGDAVRRRGLGVGGFPGGRRGRVRRGFSSPAVPPTGSGSERAGR